MKNTTITPEMVESYTDKNFSALDNSEFRGVVLHNVLAESDDFPYPDCQTIALRSVEKCDTLSLAREEWNSVFDVWFDTHLKDFDAETLSVASGECRRIAEDTAQRTIDKSSQ